MSSASPSAEDCAVFAGHCRHQTPSSVCFLATELGAIQGSGISNFTELHPPSVLSVDNLLYDVLYVRRPQFALLMVEDAVDRAGSAAPASRRAWAKCRPWMPTPRQPWEPA